MADERERLVSDVLRETILTCGQSRYAICKASGVSQANMSRFVRGLTSMHMDSMDKICDVLELTLVPMRNKTRTKPLLRLVK